MQGSTLLSMRSGSNVRRAAVSDESSARAEENSDGAAAKIPNSSQFPTDRIFTWGLSLRTPGAGPGFEPGWPEDLGILRRRVGGSEQMIWAIRCLFPPRSPRRVVESEDHGHPDGHLIQHRATAAVPK